MIGARFPRVLVVTGDELEWQALNRELGMAFDLLRANGRDQAMAVVERDAELFAVVAYWGALGSGPELMRSAHASKPKLSRVLISEAPASPEAQALISSGVVRAVVADPVALPRALTARAAAVEEHPLRAEPRVPVKVQLPVSTPAWEGFASLTTKDASRGGVFFFFAQRVVPTSGSRCTVKLGREAVEGTVAHVMTARLATATGADAGFGVSFVAPRPAEWWASLVEKPAYAAAAAGPSAPSAPSATRAPPTAKELESAKNFFTLAMSFFDDRNYAAARQKLELAARLAPDPGCEAMLAVCNGHQNLRLGLSDVAREAFERALKLDPQCSRATVGLNLLKQQKKSP
ncbi:MAG: hypothetical protein IPJ65_12620 [Archangiaceae bacterium]|nr:hypothetical protein [Archangiaceae bacterium]